MINQTKSIQRKEKREHSARNKDSSKLKISNTEISNISSISNFFMETENNKKQSSNNNSFISLLGITDSKVQCELAQSVIDDKLSVRELEILIRKLKTSPTRSKSKSSNETNPYYKDITYKLENYFGTKVNITNKNNKGKIEIEYYSEEDLQRILEIINL